MNVIIVDFRGVDTLGEIAVVMITGLSILALIRVRAGTAPAASVVSPPSGSFAEVKGKKKGRGK